MLQGAPGAQVYSSLNALIIFFILISTSTNNDIENKRAAHSRISASEWPAATSCSRHAAQPNLCSSSSPAAAFALTICIEFPKYSLGKGRTIRPLSYLQPFCIWFLGHEEDHKRAAHLQTSADTAWNGEILVVLHSELAFALSFAMDFNDKWKILTLSGGASNLLMN
ncbi:hypothetical protein RHGRI_021828 [Rhododendron griersonianum]|uniref:Uncharacterized protein n=1 Tax=Rhododendron griersonianum TaxID=479676 RepID=A0AAV6JLK8_9ERIC|nr:hypothetical protein RHGRI_021828 [Rhododendron griersonianum]